VWYNFSHHVVPTRAEGHLIKKMAEAGESVGNKQELVLQVYAKRNVSIVHFIVSKVLNRVIQMMSSLGNRFLLQHINCRKKNKWKHLRKYGARSVKLLNMNRLSWKKHLEIFSLS
jgi:hypothetical protein